MGSNSRRKGALLTFGTLLCLILVNASRYGPAPPPIYSASTFRTRQFGSPLATASTGFRSLSAPTLRTIFQCIGSGELLGGATEDDLRMPGVYVGQIVCPFDGSIHAEAHWQRAQRRSPRQRQRMERLGIRPPPPPLRVYTTEIDELTVIDENGITKTIPRRTKVTLDGCGTTTQQIFNPSTGVYDTYTFTRPCPQDKP